MIQGWLNSRYFNLTFITLSYLVKYEGVNMNGNYCCIAFVRNANLKKGNVAIYMFVMGWVGSYCDLAYTVNSVWFDDNFVQFNSIFFIHVILVKNSYKKRHLTIV